MDDSAHQDRLSGSAERRSGTDRRAPQAFPPSFSAYRRRRSRGRRKSDKGAYVDIYDDRTCRIALAILALSLLDAVLTGAQILQGKSREANPLMDIAIYHGGLVTFFSLKAAMTAFPLAIIVVHKEWALARYAARLCLWCYIAVALYHIYLVLI